MCECALRSIPNEYSYKWHYAMNHAAEIETLVLGNSHAYFGIDTDVFTPLALNAANVSQTLEKDDLFLRKHLPSLVKLKRVVITVSYHSLFRRLNTGVEAWRETYYRIYWHESGVLPIKYNFEVCSPFPGYRIIKAFTRHRQRPCGKTGMFSGCKLSRRKDDWRCTGPVAAERHTVSGNQRVFDDNCRLLKAMVAECMKKKIKVYILTLPAWSTYTAKLDPEQLRMTVDMCKRSVSSPNCYYYNFLEDSTFSEADFYDADHLNEFGASKMAKKLADLFDADLDKARGVTLK